MDKKRKYLSAELTAGRYIIIYIFPIYLTILFSVIELPYFLKYTDVRRLAQSALTTCISYPMVPGILVTAAVSILSIP